MKTLHSSFRSGIAAAVLSLTACAPFDYRAHDQPRAEPAVAPSDDPPRVALVLGSGGPRGYAHIGVLTVLEEAGIAIDLVVGSSVGAVVGAFWADGRSAAEIDVLASSGGPLTLFDVNLFADRGWIRGQRLQDYVNDALGNRSLEDLHRPLIVAATRRDDKTPVFFSRGNAGVAVRASSAVPGIISPVGINGVEYEDADESLPLAVRAARQAGAQFVIAVDVSTRRERSLAEAKPAQLERDERRMARISPELELADFLIHPDLPYDAGPRRSYFKLARQVGEDTARAMLPELMQSLSEQTE